jgi:NADPH:quinone reductase-like Zn-dependent oxidoreductase
MRQIWISKAGAPDVLQVREAPDPEAGPGTVRIRVKATGVNFADVMARMGLYPDAPPLPCVVGYEVAGVVDQVGSGVTGFAPGDRVGALTRFGGYSDTVVVPVAQATRLAEGLSFEAAAAIPVNWLTAWLMLVHLGNVHAGERVLVHAAAGGVGQAAVQIARWRGATVIGTASRAKHERLREAGVEHTIDYHVQDFETEVMKLTGGKGVHIVLDAVGGASFQKSYRCLAPLGRLFLFGVSSFVPNRTRMGNVLSALSGLWSMPRFRSIPLMDDNRGVHGINLGHLWSEVETLGASLREIFDLVEQGRFKPVIDSTFPFDNAALAHTRLQDHGNFGKVLLLP